MSGPPLDIFAKIRLTPGQLRAVAERRFADARCLLDSGDAERANGAIYMVGFVIECLLKALLLAVPVDAAALSASDREVLHLLYSHELDDMLGFLPEIKAKFAGLRLASGRPVWQTLRNICEEWTVFARYSTKSAKPAQAREYLATIEEVKKWLKEL
jgi:hypothetical protein